MMISNIFKSWQSTLLSCFSKDLSVSTASEKFFCRRNITWRQDENYPVGQADDDFNQDDDDDSGDNNDDDGEKNISLLC